MNARHAVAVLLLLSVLASPGLPVGEGARAAVPSPAAHPAPAVPAPAVAVASAPLRAHASAQLPHATLRAEGAQVHVTWTAAPDDVADVGVAIGALPPSAVDAYLGGDLDDLPDPATLEAFFASPALHDYLLTHIRILQDGHACPGQVVRTEGFIERGVDLTFNCPAEVTDATVQITMLHDRDPAYRTFSVDGTIQTAVHTIHEPAHPWDFTGSTAGARGWLRPSLLGGLAFTVVLLLAGLRLLPRREVRRRGSG